MADACTKGGEGECGKVAFKEYGKFALVPPGGWQVEYMVVQL
ncbi:hypothetical protein EJP617_33870 [Erwinia sp. Ejp617]|nr:hypothetical protein EJP617_33870 [Erwinia sp. Ejp617]